MITNNINAIINNYATAEIYNTGTVNNDGEVDNYGGIIRKTETIIIYNTNEYITGIWNGKDYNTHSDQKPAPFTVSGKIKSYVPQLATTLKLMQGDVVKYTTAILPTDGTGQREQSFIFRNVAAGTYTLEITKILHTKCIVNNIVIVVGAEGIIIPMISLVFGDITGDGMVNSEDLNIIWSSENYGKGTITIDYIKP
jgi:hypothetical protein